MRDDHIDLCGQVDFTRTEAMPLLEREAQFCFACAGCGDCCRGREDIVVSGFDLWRKQFFSANYLKYRKVLMSICIS